MNVLDADSTQCLAILDVSSGRNMVIQGPPGTGKSQTIVNLIAAAIGSGKKVLFVAEKKAALEVVKRRLDKIGLGVACLELHSNKVKKKEVIGELKRTASLQSSGGSRGDADESILRDARKQLNEYCQAVNAQAGSSGKTIHDLYGVLLPILTKLKGTSIPELELQDILTWNPGDVHRRRDIVARLQDRLGELGVPSQHAFWGSQLRIVLPATRESVRNVLSKAAEASRSLGDIADRIAALLEQAVPQSRNEFVAFCANAKQLADAPDLSGMDLHDSDWIQQDTRIRRGIAALARYQGLTSQWRETIKQTGWSVDVATLEAAASELGKTWWRFISPRWGAVKREIRGLITAPLPKSTDQIIEILKAISIASENKAELESCTPLLSKLFGGFWKCEASDLKLLERQLDWISCTLQGIQSGRFQNWCLEESQRLENKNAVRSMVAKAEQLLADYDSVFQRVVEVLKLDSACDGGLQSAMKSVWPEKAVEFWRGLSSQVDELDSLVAYGQVRDECVAEGLDSVAALADHWECGRDHLLDLFEYTEISALLDAAFQDNPVLARFDSLQQSGRVQTFRQLDTRKIHSTCSSLVNSHITSLPKPTSSNGQIGVLWREFEKKARYLPIRKLIQKAGNVVQAIKPVFMMSPLSVANFLPPGTVQFDLVIFDEASQVKPADALGAIVRASQAVVVGDSKQLPPTSFFESMFAQDDETEEENAVATSDIESVLGLFCSRGAHQRMLRWHYRSKHESLIAGSNHLFYDDRLVVFPSPDRHKQNVGLIYHRVENAPYDRSRTRTNPGEARAVAEAVMQCAAEQLRKPKDRRFTLGVAALSVAQRDAILDQLEVLRRKAPQCEEFFMSPPHEQFFVKNLENVQGDERDVILISIGYGRTSEGYLSMSFGPVNRAGGERRLNVLFSRARRRCEVFTTLRADDIDTGGNSEGGVYALKSFLQFAEHGFMDVPVSTGRPPDSPFEEQVLRALQRLGYEVNTQVGSAGFYLDLAIVDPSRPGRYLLGIECDGAAYHSARSSRDRDRLRQSVLESLGWRIYRIWSTAWFRSPDKELESLRKTIERARSEGLSPKLSVPRTLPVNSANVGNRDGADHDSMANDVPPLPQSTPGVPKYRFAEIQVHLGHSELHTISSEALSQWLAQVVAVEGPVHWLEAARRVANAAGIQRAGSRIQEAFQRACRYGSRSKRFVYRDGFLWADESLNLAVRDRSDFPPQLKKLEYVAPEEICAAIEQSVDESFGLATDEVAVSACRLLGFARVSEDMRVIAERQRDCLLQEGRLLLRGETVIRKAETK
jgi:very-short-patch-repair endonuclease